MPVDKFGLPFLYPSKAGGWFFQQSDNIEDDDEVLALDDISDIDEDTGAFTIAHDQSDSWTINKDPSFSASIGGSNMDFAETEARGYGYKKDQPRDVELKMLVHVLDSPDDTGLSLSGPTGRHSGDGNCSGFAYMFSAEDPNDSPQKFRFRKEMWHVNYDDDPKTGSWTHPKFNFSLGDVGRFVGLCYVRYNKKDGRGAGRDSVVIEGWGNPDPEADPNNWIMMKRTEDKGGWGDGGGDCNGEDDQVGTWSNAVFRIKNSNMTIRYKNVSLREIDPTQGFDTTPDTPEPTEQPTTPSRVKGTFRIEMDVNVAVNSVCSPSGTSLFYDHLGTGDKALSEDDCYY